MRTLLRYAWAGPATVFGMGLATLALWRGRVRGVDGVVEAYGPLLHFLLSHLIPLAGGACAMTFGHVVVGASAKALDETRTHERVHIRQYEQWGPLFVPAYLASRGRAPGQTAWRGRARRTASPSASTSSGGHYLCPPI